MVCSSHTQGSKMDGLWEERADGSMAEWLCPRIGEKKAEGIHCIKALPLLALGKPIGSVLSFSSYIH